ncbi:MAG: ROK family protein [Solobacterium sp.]|nr:ROK family protein [Solobacterium sp.]
MSTQNIVETFREWILKQTDPAYTIEPISTDQIDYVTDSATAHVQFYHLEYEIVSFTIDSPKAEDPLFFLHFELQDLEHARKLFREMIQSLKNAGSQVATKVLLSCSSGFTTSFFADRLNTAAETLGLDYSFSAVSYTDLFEAAVDQDVILLAPQIGYLLKKAQEILKDKIILQIPTDVFATYNVNKLLELVGEELAKKEKAETVTEDTHDPEWDSSIMILAIVKSNGRFVIHYRGADNEEPMDRGVVVKDKFDKHDLEDLLDVLFIRYPRIKGVGIVTPGIVHDGHLTFRSAGIVNLDLVGEFTKKYHRPFILCNDANATAVGYFANHRDCGDLLVYYHPLGNVVGGAGTVIDGRLQIGKHDIAGEVGNYLKFLNFSEDRFDLARTPEGIVEYITKVTLPMICTVGPDTLAVYCDLLTDTEELKAGMMKYLPEEYLPEIHKVKSNLYDLFYGAGVMLYNLLHGNIEYRDDLKEYRG